jgi:hypothetical protein
MLRRPRVFSVALTLFASACASSASPSPDPIPGGTGSGATRPTPVAQAAWPVRTNEHLDLWLHGYALVTPDTTLVPYFQRGYRARIEGVRRQRGVTSLLDGNRERLLARINVNPQLATSGQFLPLYFESYEQMRQVIDLFVRNNGNPGNSQDPNLRTYFAIIAGAFQTAPDREWLRTFVESVDDESRKFYHEHWTAQTQARAGVIAHVDSTWQRTWRPAFQRFLNNTQQQNGEVYLSAPLDGEGRTVHLGKVQNAVAVGMPDGIQNSESVLYTFAHEIAGTVASTAIEDNTTPADRRAGTTARFEQSAAVRAGALLLERILPTAVPGYMRYYLQSAGRTASTEPRAAFVSTFAVPDPVNEAISRQIEVILGGI